ncbi:MAG: iron-containing alcohol dehydrogenase [Fuerstiella sp.]|nr:iron-containing alcohol dehydrogenase [Fuerstiella sp.]
MTSSEHGLSSFQYQPRTRLIFGQGAVDRLSDLVLELGGSRVLLVTDAGLRKAGHCSRAAGMLRAAGISVFVFDRVSENPTTEDVERCTAFAEPHKVDFIVGLGGGSSIDCAKGANFLLTSGGQMQDYRGVGKAKAPMLPMISVPTTAGTGSEAQSFAVIADPVTHMKMPCGDPRAACRAAILDPELTVTMPHSVATVTGIDAMTHAIESFVTKNRNPVSQMFARQAWRLLSDAFPAILDNPGDLEARGRMQLGAHFAGTAIENSMLGAAHALANPLTAHFGTVHGRAVGLLLPRVIRWNISTVGELYHDLAVSAGWAESTDSPEHASRELADRFTKLLVRADMPTSLAELADENELLENIRTLSEEASQQWTGTFNPRKMDADDFCQVYRNALASGTASVKHVG